MDTTRSPLAAADRRPAPVTLPRGAWRRPRLVVCALAVAAFALALLRPGFTLEAPVGSTLLVVDITQSMNTTDMRLDGALVTRLDYVRQLLRRVARELPCGHTVGVGVFTERKTLVLLAPIEVCAHQAAIDDVLEAVDWRMAWAADSHLYYGTYSALDEIARHWPGTGLAFFSDGHQAPAVVPGREPRYERDEHTPPGILFAVGGELPQPVPHLDADGRVTGYWTAEEAAAFAPTGGQRTLSVLEMEALKARGGDARNAPAERPADAQAEQLSRRHEDLLQAVAARTGLQVAVAGDAADVVQRLRALPSARQAAQRHELHDALVVLGVLALLGQLLPWRWLDGRPSSAAASSSASASPAGRPPGSANPASERTFR